MEKIERHKVFISYYHEDDQLFKDTLIEMKEWDDDKRQYVSIFDDYSVHENEIDDTDMTDEQIRREIRDNYIADASVLILLCGKNTSKRKHIDWEIHAAMYDSDKNPKMGILVINLPSIETSSCMLANDNVETSIMGPDMYWEEASRDIDKIRKNYPYLPERIINNLTRKDVKITIANWNRVCNNVQSIKKLIDNAFKRRKTNNYNTSDKLKGRNS